MDDVACANFSFNRVTLILSLVEGLFRFFAHKDGHVPFNKALDYVQSGFLWIFSDVQVPHAVDIVNLAPQCFSSFVHAV